MAKAKLKKYKLRSTATKKNGKQSEYCYTYTGKADKLEIMKYDPLVRRHVLFKQEKLK